MILRGREGLTVLSLASMLFSSLVHPAHAQTVTQRGFLGGAVVLFPQKTTNDRTQLVGDLLAQEELVFKPASWVQFAAGC